MKASALHKVSNMILRYCSDDARNMCSSFHSNRLGFFVMLGYGSGFFNNSLSIYYVLVVVYSWKEFQLRQARPFLLIVPVVCAMVLAFGGIPFYDSAWVGCWLLPRPYTDDWSAFGFSFGPVITTSIISTACNIRVYWSVRSTVRKGQQWSMEHRLKQRSEKDKYTYNAPSNNTSQFSIPTPPQEKPQREEEEAKKNDFSCNCCKNSPLFQDNAEAAVFWQSAFYLTAYYLCWPILLVGVTNADSQNLGFWIALSILAPLQGFFNMLVYIRPRFGKWRRAKKMEKERKRKLLEKQQKAKISQRAVMNNASGGTAAVSQSYRHENDLFASAPLSPQQAPKPAPVPGEATGVEEGTPGDATKKSDGSSVPEGSAWDLAMSNDDKDLDGYSKQFECLA